MWTFHGDLTREEWLKEWFGYNGGRELGDPLQRFTDNPNDIVAFVDECKAQNKPAYMSVAYRKRHDVVSGLDRIYFDFDCKEPKVMNAVSVWKYMFDKRELDLNVMKFVRMLIREVKVVPMVVRTYHGYHIWVFLKTTLIGHKDDLAKIYMSAQKKLLRGEEYNFDTQIFGDVKRIARIPLSWHEKGRWCEVVELDEGKDEFVPVDKIRSVDFYKLYGLLTDEIVEDAKLIRNADVEREIYTNHDVPKVAGHFKIRPCFLHALKMRNMSHQQRLAFVIEAYYALYNTNEIIELFREYRKIIDFNETITKYQVDWQIRKIVSSQTKPYKCSTIKNLNWCLGKVCPYYR